MPIIRFRSKDGMFRINAEETKDFLLVIEEILAKIKTDFAGLYISDKPNEKGEMAAKYCGRTVAELGLKNGDLLFLNYESVIENKQEKQTIDNGSVSINVGKTVPISSFGPSGPMNVKQLAIDDILDKQEGLIKRPRSNFCRHSEKGMCEYCSPLPPWDKSHREENNIKHISFHAYVKELNESKNNKNNATSYIAPLEEADYNIDLNCKGGHLPYPRGICSKCQTPAISLQQQEFRMIDHVEFQDSSIINSFIDSWRSSGTQRIGYLYGRYDVYDKVPLGIKALVESIYEPPQSNESDGLQLLDWEEENRIDELANKLGLNKVGVIFTDLTDSGKGDGSVYCKRHKDSYFLSSLEVLLSGTLQLKYPNVTKYSSSGRFSSKFVTCVISGNLQGEIDIASYQVSNDAEALIKADMITGSTQPSMAYINATDEKRYVPDIFFNTMNEYGLKIKKNAKPAFPVDYLLVTATHGFPENASSIFNSTRKFAIENRQHLGVSQDFHEINRQLNSDSSGQGTGLWDFHFMAYLTGLDILGESELNLIVKYILEKNYEDYLRLEETPGWQTLLAIVREST